MGIEPLGALPKYAEKADRAKVVRILCKGVCRTGTYAELNRVFPGKNELWNSPEGEYEAVCLKCGGIAKDYYNWHR